MRSIMRETFKIQPQRRLNIDTTKGEDEILKAFTRYFIRNRTESYTLPEIKFALGYLGLRDVQLKNNLDELPQELKEHMDELQKQRGSEFRVLQGKKHKPVRKADEQAEKETETIYVLVDIQNKLTPARQASLLYFKGVKDSQFMQINVAGLCVMGNMYQMVPDDVWLGISKEIIERVSVEKYEVYERLFGTPLEIVYAWVSEFTVARIKNSTVKQKLGQYNPFIDTLRTALVKRLMRVYQQEINYVDFMDYTQQVTKEYAKAFQTKKNIPNSHLAVMKETALNKYFSFIELDELVDLDKFKKAEQEMLRVIPLLPQSPSKKELRFRRLGNYRAAGLYYPQYQCIVVDIRDIWSFVHEYAHYLDYTYSKEPLSISEDFLDITERYHLVFDQLNKEERVNKNTAQYYKVSTEIFARAFETVYGQQLATFLVTKPNQHKQEIQIAYQPFYQDKELRQAIEDYFRQLFG